MLNVELRRSLIYIICLFSWNCKNAPQPDPVPAFYHWQQNFDLSANELSLLDQLSCEKIYLRLFDLDLNNDKTAVEPYSVLSGVWPTERSLTIVPTIFITNRSFINLDEISVDSLADRLYRKASSLIRKAPEGVNINEWQLDCDWSAGTRDAFFRFAKRIREKLKITDVELSATIRLHQIKYADKTGVPPVDRGMLMFYNMDNVRESDTENSILDLEVAAQYLSGFDQYPLSLDLALPTFSWAVWQRADKTLGLLYPFDASTLNDTSRVKRRSDGRFELLKSTYLDGRFLYTGDLLRLEVAETGQLLKAMDLLQDHLRPEVRTIAFFALDHRMTKYYSHESLEQILFRWRPVDQ